MSQLAGAQRAKFRQPREPYGWYTEPQWCDQQLFATLDFSGPIHDSCCGEGRIPQAAIAAGYAATGSDLIDRGYGTSGIDFLKDNTRRSNLVFSPPSNPRTGIYIDPFIQHALAVAVESVTVIVPVAYLCGQDRYRALYSVCPPSLILTCSQRPSMPPGGMGIKESNGTTDYLWLHWSRQEPQRRRSCEIRANGWWRATAGTVIDWLEPLAPFNRGHGRPSASPARRRRRTLISVSTHTTAQERPHGGRARDAGGLTPPTAIARASTSWRSIWIEGTEADSERERLKIF